MSKKIVSPRSVQKVVVLDRLQGPVTVHKRRSKKKKAEKQLKKLFSGDPLKQTARAMRDMSGAMRLANGVASMASAFSPMMPPRPRIKFGW